MGGKNLERGTISPCWEKEDFHLRVRSFPIRKEPLIGKKGHSIAGSTVKFRAAKGLKKNAMGVVPRNGLLVFKKV